MLTITEITLLSVYKVLTLNLFPLNYFSDIKELNWNLYYKSIVMKTVYYLLNNKYNNLWNKIQTPETDQHTWSTNFQQRCQGNSIEKQMMLEKQASICK